MQLSVLRSGDFRRSLGYQLFVLGNDAMQEAHALPKGLFQQKTGSKTLHPMVRKKAGYSSSCCWPDTKQA